LPADLMASLTPRISMASLTPRISMATNVVSTRRSVPSLLTVCPVIIPPRPGLLESWDHSPHVVVVNGCHDLWAELAVGRDWIVVDDERRNRGCPASWNCGFRIAQERGTTHVGILSQSLVAAGAISSLARQVARRADERGAFTRHSFHCVVFSVELWTAVGGFDEELPIFADVDFLRRAFLAGLVSPDRRLPQIDIVAVDEKNAAARAGAVSPELYTIDEQRYIGKWGGTPGQEADNPMPWKDGGFTL
jgi:hypothetical protein